MSEHEIQYRDTTSLTRPIRQAAPPPAGVRAQKFVPNSKIHELYGASRARSVCESGMCRLQFTNCDLMLILFPAVRQRSNVSETSGV